MKKLKYLQLYCTCLFINRKKIGREAYILCIYICVCKDMCKYILYIDIKGVLFDLLD